MLAALPAASKIALPIGATVTTSLPLGVPDKPMPSVYTLPLIDMLVGVPLVAPPVRVAAPEAITIKKSDTSRAPLAPLVLYTASFMVTAIVVLSNAKETDDIVGAA